MNRTITTRAPFDLRVQNSFFGGWPTREDTDKQYSIVITFPIEGWKESAAVVIRQDNEGTLSAEAFGTKNYSEQAIDQALSSLSLDVDDTEWQAVGRRDKVIGDLQATYQYLRPILFHSPYEAAAGFVIGQRISIKQRQAIQKKMAEQFGDKIDVSGETFAAFPSPQVLETIPEFPGLSEAKIHRLHGVAGAALDGTLDRNRLLSMPEEKALETLQQLDGIGPFYASGILYRGAGVVDGVTDDSLTKYAIQNAYQLPKEPSQQEVLKIAESWRPFRMWAEVLIHVWVRREIGLPRR